MLLTTALTCYWILTCTAHVWFTYTFPCTAMWTNKSQFETKPIPSIINYLQFHAIIFHSAHVLLAFLLSPPGTRFHRMSVNVHLLLVYGTSSKPYFSSAFSALWHLTHMRLDPNLTTALFKSFTYLLTYLHFRAGQSKSEEKAGCSIIRLDKEAMHQCTNGLTQQNKFQATRQQNCDK